MHGFHRAGLLQCNGQPQRGRGIGVFDDADQVAEITAGFPGRVLHRQFLSFGLLTGWLRNHQSQRDQDAQDLLQQLRHLPHRMLQFGE